MKIPRRTFDYRYLTIEMKTKSFLYSILITCASSLLLLDMVASFAAYTDEEDQKYAESRFLGIGPYPQLRKVIPVKEMAELFNMTGVCDLKPGNFMALCNVYGAYKKTRFPYEPYAMNESLVPEKCKQQAVRFHWVTDTSKESVDERANYFTTKFYWENETRSHDPLVKARKCPTTGESPKVWLSDGRESGAYFVYMRSAPGRTHLRLDDYVFFAKDYYYEQKN